MATQAKVKTAERFLPTCKHGVLKIVLCHKCVEDERCDCYGIAECEHCERRREKAIPSAWDDDIRYMCAGKCWGVGDMACWELEPACWPCAECALGVAND